MTTKLLLFLSAALAVVAFIERGNSSAQGWAIVGLLLCINGSILSHVCRSK